MCKFISNIFMGYAILGCIPVFLTTGKISFILLTIQIVSLLLAILFDILSNDE